MSRIFTKTMSPKHPSVARNYYLDATNLLDTGVTISSATVVPAPTGITVGKPVVQTPDNKVVKVLVGGGTSGETYELTFTLTLSDSEVEVAIMQIPVSLVA